MNRITPISGVDNSAAPTEFRPLLASPLGHLIVDVANAVFTGTIGTVDQGAANTLANGWPVKLTDGTNLLGTALNPLQIGDGGGSITIDGTVFINDGGNVISIDDAGGSLTVDGTLAVTQSGAWTVAATQNGTWILGSNSGIDIGDVTINNAAGVNAVNIQDGGNSITIDNATLSVIGGGTEATALRVTIATDSTGVLSVDDNGTTLSVDDGAGSLTVDNPTLSVVGGGLEATALRVTIASDSTGLVSIDDNGSSLTVDTPQLPAALVGGRLDENIGAWLGSTAPTVGQKTAVASVPVVLASDQSVIPVSDNAGSLTVDNPVLSVIGGGTEAAAQRVTIANDSTGVLSVDDNGGSLTTDNPAASQADGHSVTIGATADADTANTVIGRLKAIFNKLIGTSGANAPATNYLVDRLADGTGFIASGTDHPAAADRGLVVRNIPRKSPTATITVTAGSTSSITVLAANSARLRVVIVNDTNRVMTIKFGTTASTTDWTKKLAADEYYEVPIEYTGRVDAIWPAGVAGNARVTEIA